MIVNNYKLFLEQLKLIDVQSYEWPWFDEGWVTANEYSFRILVEGNALGSSNVVIGYSCYRTVPSTNSNGREVYLAKLCVRPQYRKQGFGSRLMTDIIQVAGARKLYTILHEENKYLSWAKDWGWACTGLERGLWPDGRDGLLFEFKSIPTIENINNERSFN